MNDHKQSEFLYTLIDKMNGSEKRYFKISCRHHIVGNENNYQKLFDLIIKHQKQGWKGEKSLKKDFILKYGKNRFDLYKANLYNKILSSLESFHRTNNITVDLRSKLNQANILHGRGLPHQSLSLLKKSKSICEEHGKWYLLLEILEMKRHILYSIQYPSLDNKEEENILCKALAESSHRSIQSKLWKTFITHGLPTDEKTLSVYKNLSKDLDQIKPDDHHSTLEIKMIRLYCMQFISGMEGDIPSTYKYGSILINLMDENPIYMSDKAEFYIRILINLQYAQIRLNKIDEVVISREKCRLLFQKLSLVPAFEFTIHISLYVNEYDMAFKNSNIDDLNRIIGEFHNYFSSHISYNNPSTNLLHTWQMSIHNFVFENYQTALNYNYEIIDQKIPYRYDIQSLARLMNLIIYYELGEERLLRSFVVNTYRYLKKRERLLPVESFLINFVKKVLSKNKFLIDRKKSFNVFKSQLAQLKGREDSHEALLLMYIEFWLDKKIEGKKIIA